MSPRLTVESSLPFLTLLGLCVTCLQQLCQNLLLGDRDIRLHKQLCIVITRSPFTRLEATAVDPGSSASTE